MHFDLIVIAILAVWLVCYIALFKLAQRRRERALNKRDTRFQDACIGLVKSFEKVNEEHPTPVQETTDETYLCRDCRVRRPISETVLRFERTGARKRRFCADGFGCRQGGTNAD